MDFIGLRMRSVALGALVLLLASSLGCGTDDKEAAPSGQPSSGAQRTAASATQASQPRTGFGGVVAASELVVGENRFVFGIIDNATGQPVPDAQVRFRFFTVQGNQGTLKSEADGTFIAPARDAGVAGIIQHKHADGTDHPHANVEADVGVYIATATFDQAGDWGVEAAFRTKDGKEDKATVPFKVLPQATTPAVGAQAPRTKNPTARDVKNLTEISSAIDPTPALYQTTVADAIAAGKPALVAFVTPGYCSTRFYGPAYEVVKKLLPTYGDKAALIHIEIWKDPIKRVPADAVAEWRLQTEPYIFVIDRNGAIAAKFEGPVSLAELEAALAKVTS
jgi:hypothetical protein